MNAKKGLVALAVASVIATPLAAQAKSKLITFDAAVATNGANGGYGVMSIDTATSVAYANDDVTVDAILVSNAAQDYILDTTQPYFVGTRTAGVDIGYYADVPLPDEGTLEFSVSGGAGGFSAASASNMKIVAQDTSGNFYEVGSIIDYSAANGAASRLVFQIDTDSVAGPVDFYTSSNDGDATLDAGESATMAAGGDPIPANTQLWIARPLNGGAYQPAEITVFKGATAGQTISLSLDKVTNTAGVNLQAGIPSSPSVVATITNGLAVTVDDQATSTIDVESVPSRTRFVSEGAMSDTPTDLTSVASLTLNTGADIGVELVGSEDVEISFQRRDGESLSGVDSVDLNSTAFVLDTDTNVFAASGALNGAFGLGTSASPSSSDFTITADGADVLFPNDGNVVDWEITSFTVDTGASAYGVLDVPVLFNETGDAKAVDEDGATHVWDINGAQFKVPYVYHIAGSSTTNSTVKITNEYSQEAGVTVEAVVAEAGLGAKQFTTSDLVAELGAIPANGQLTLSGSEIAVALGLDPEKNWHMELTFLVNAPQNSIHAAAQNTSANGRADSPVLYRTNNTADGRQWQ